MFFIWRREEIEQLLCEKKEELIGYWENQKEKVLLRSSFEETSKRWEENWNTYYQKILENFKRIDSLSETITTDTAHKEKLNDNLTKIQELINNFTPVEKQEIKNEPEMQQVVSDLSRQMNEINNLRQELIQQRGYVQSLEKKIDAQTKLIHNLISLYERSNNEPSQKEKEPVKSPVEPAPAEKVREKENVLEKAETRELAASSEQPVIIGMDPDQNKNSLKKLIGGCSELLAQLNVLITDTKKRERNEKRLARCKEQMEELLEQSEDKLVGSELVAPLVKILERNILKIKGGADVEKAIENYLAQIGMFSVPLVVGSKVTDKELSYISENCDYTDVEKERDGEILEVASKAYQLDYMTENGKCSYIVEGSFLIGKGK